MAVVSVSVLLMAVAALHIAGAQQLYEGSRCHNEAVNRRGSCRQLSNCPWAEDQIRKHKYPQVCSWSLNLPIVCCPENTSEQLNNGWTPPTQRPTQPPTQRPTQRPTPRPTGRPAVQQRGRIAKKMCEKYSEYVFQEEEAFALSPLVGGEKIDKCAIPAEPLILGGEDVAANEFPHMALLGYGDDENNIQYLCGGSLIAPNFVLTAGHCLFTQSGQPARWVLLGDLDLSTTKDDASPQRLEVAQAIKHPNYKPPQHYNDIALLRLKRAAEMTAYVRPACVYTENTLPASRPKPLATGWGHTEFGGDPSSIMMKVALPLQPYRLCNDSYRSVVGIKLPRGILDDTQLCAGDLAGGKDTCQGDSGGPLQTFTNEKPYYCMHHVLGVTSFGKGCGFRNSPAVYSRVSAFVPWIESVVWPNEQ